MLASRHLALLIPALVVACASASEVERPPVTVTASTNPTDLRLGDTARVVIDLVNVSNEVVWIGPAGCNYDFVIANAAGAVFHPAEQIYCTLALLAPVELSPGETYQIQAFTTGRVIAQGSQAEPSMLEPGTYSIRAVLAVLRGQEDHIQVKSSPSTITFRAN
ncbi:MAG TPA: hypothetical protein VLE53_00430 [Gemmatimonadaceae bacterium]|nr:hypothetical protein [Gemmatimonadaceae bacterium]